MADEVQHEPVVETPDAAPTAPVAFTAPSDPNYHIFLWTEPPGMPPTYLCLLCAFADATEAEVQAHVTEVHALTPVPTPMAASPPLLEEATGLLAVPNQEGRDDG